MFICDVCGKNFYDKDIKKAKCAFLAHLQSHGLDKSHFVHNILKLLNNPKCACQKCCHDVSIHGRKMKFNLFADDCPNKSKFLSPASIEFYAFNDYNVDEAIDKIRKIQSKNILENHKELLKLKNSGNKNPSSIFSICKRTNKSVDEVKKILVKNSKKGKDNPFYGKKHSKQTLEKLAISRSNTAKIVSKPELILYGILCGMELIFEYQIPIGIYVVDFKINNTIIEVYGDYWHSKTMKSREKQKQKDELKEKYLRNNGYNLIIFWESDLINNTMKVINEIKKNKENKLL